MARPGRKRTNKPGYLYVITHPTMPGLFKIGRSSRPTHRLSDANTWCPQRAYVLVGAVHFTNVIQAEKVAHLILEDVGSGGEWFAPRLGSHPLNMLRGLARREKNLL